MEQFKTIKINNQIWIRGNLNIGNFRNGHLITEVKTTEELKDAVDLKNMNGYYDNDPLFTN